jgi:hypothetical protein
MLVNKPCTLSRKHQDNAKATRRPESIIYFKKINYLPSLALDSQETLTCNINLKPGSFTEGISGGKNRPNQHTVTIS